jgi:hypothetical protein
MVCRLWFVVCMVKVRYSNECPASTGFMIFYETAYNDLLTVSYKKEL